MGWALSRVYGDGTAPRPRGQTKTNGPWRAAASAYGPHISLFAPDRAWALVYGGAGYDWVAAEADTDVRVFGDLSLSHVLTAQQANLVNTRAAQFGVTAGAAAGMTVEAVVQSIANQIDPQWDVAAQKLG